MKNADDLDKFLNIVKNRLEKGSEDYDEASFDRPTSNLLQEIVEELADVAGWAAVLAARIFELQRKAEKL